MNPEQFLNLVVPQADDGFTTIHWVRPKPRKGAPRPKFNSEAFKTAAEAARFAASLNGKGFDIYFHTARNTGSRQRADALLMGSVFIDADIDPQDPKCFPSLHDALVELLGFCQQMGIPEPSLVVMSGGGVHVYWLSDRHLDIDSWDEFADSLRNAMEHAGLRVKDKGLTTDAARVLRVPETTNYKPKKEEQEDGTFVPQQRQVYLLEGCSTFERHDFSVAFAPLKKFASVQRVKSKANIIPFPHKPSAVFADLKMDKKLGDGIAPMPPLPFEPIRVECAWLREAYETGGKDFYEPQWNLTTLIATWLEDGNDYAHKFGNQHPGYSFESTEDKWNDKIGQRRPGHLGWPGCRAVQNTGSRHCKTCPHFAAGQSPLHLGIRGADAHAEAKQTKEQYEKELKEVGGTRPQELRLPEGFALDKKGRICAFFPSQVDKKGVRELPQLLHILKTQIRAPILQHQSGQFGLGFTATTDKDNEHEVFLPAANMIVKNGLEKTLASKFVIHNPLPKAVEMLNLFPSSWIDLLREENLATRDSGTLGWRYEDGEKTGFVYGNVFYHQDGSKRPLVNPADDEFRSWYVPVGSREIWLKACKLLTDRKRPELDILIAVAFAAPLTAFGGTLYGATLSVWGRPGTAKSTAQQVAAAVFGHPKQTRESLNSTPKSIQGRLGRTRNLAAYWDDIQNEQHQDNLFSTMFVAAGGLEGGRLNQDASMKERLEWQTLLVACSNASFIEYLTKKQKSTTAGMRRVFEIEFNKRDDEPGMIDAVDASLTFAGLEHNYGVIGAEYSQILAICHKDIAIAVRDETKRFKAAVNGSGDESFWWGACGVLLVGASLANNLGAELDIEAMDKFLQAAFQRNRLIRAREGTEGGTREHTEGGLTSFVNKYVGEGNVLFTKLMYTVRGCDVGQLHPPGDNRQILIQVARDDCKIIISRKAFKEYLQKNEIHSRQVIDGLKTEFKAEEVKLTLGAGTAFALSQEWCYVIPVPLDELNHPLRDTLFQRGTPVPHLREVGKG